jgi:regulator of RNase E activity RraA
VTGPTASLARYATSTISDALDVVGVDGTVWGPTRMSGDATVAGPAYTVCFEDVAEGEVGPAADYIDHVPSGAVIVLANAGRPCTVWGDILTQAASRRGVAATVIDGLCRDIDAIRDVKYPLWARGVFMRTGKNRVRLDYVQRPVAVGDARGRVVVRPGDLVCADGNGVVVIPANLVDDIAELAAQIAAMEHRVSRDIATGTPLHEARARHGYHEAARRPRSDRI